MSKYSAPKNFFLHLLMMVLVYMLSISLMVLWFHYLEVLVPDALGSYYYGIHNGIRWSSAMLLVSLPVFLLVNSLVEKDSKKHSEVKDSAIRKWLIYLTLFVSAITMIVNLIILVNKFYSGDLTLQFALKSLVLLAIAGFVFFYYLQDLNNKIVRKKVYGVGVGTVVLLSLVVGFFIVGSPAEQRKTRLDEARISDLENLSWNAQSFWEMNKTLPESLEELTGDYIDVSDPVTGDSYEYRKISDLKFELCANFDTKSRLGADRSYYGTGIKTNWTHDVGRHCFEMEVDQRGLKS